MTITFVAVGTTATGNNTSVVPGAPAGVTAGDLALILVSIRNSGAGVPVAPAGWAKVVDAGNVAVLGRYWQTGDTAPTVTFTGGVANADTQAVMVAWRGVAPDQLTALVSATLLNGSAQNVAYPALDVPGSGHAVMVLGWKQDDSTAASVPAGYTSALYSSVTTGDDATLTARYIIETAEVDVGASSLTITGGVAAISRGVVLALHPAAAISATLLDLYPPRILVSVTGLSTNDDVSIYRVVGGQRALVRAGTGQAVVDPSFLRVDGELPFGIPVSYVAVVNDSAEYTTGAVSYTLPGGNVAISDAITGEAAEAVILAWEEKAYDTRATVFAVGGRNVVVSGGLGMFTATIELYFEAYSGGQQLFSLIGSATEGIMQIRVPDQKYNGVDCYVAVLAARERRYSQDGSDDRRTWVLDVAQVEPWSAEQEASGFTWQNLADFYGTGTWSNVASDFATWLALGQGDFS